MLKHRIIVGIAIAIVFVTMLWFDSFLSRGWPDAAGSGGGWSLPPGFTIALVALAIIPWAVLEMRNLLKRENVDISLRVTIAAAILCMLWPWVEQISETLLQRHNDLQTIVVAPISDNPSSIASAIDEAQDRQEAKRDAIEQSPWFPFARAFHTVKPHYLIPTILALSLVAAFIKHSRNQRVDGAMASAGGTLLAIVYLGVLPGFFLPICMTHSAWMLLAFVFNVKCADIGAFVTGKLIGKHKLIPWLSPGKTIEGFIGGLVLASIVGAVLAYVFQATHGAGAPGQEIRWMKVSVAGALIGGAICGLILGAVGQLGDLLESLLKRDAGVKDSGTVPGYGGVLDLLDSPLLAAPVAYWLLKLALPG